MNLFVLFSGLPWPARGIPVFTDDLDQSIRGVIEFMIREYALKGPGWRGVVQKALELMLMLLERQMADTSSGSPLADRLERALVAGFANPDLDVDAEIARLGASPDYTRRAFRQAKGKSPQPYVIELRLHEARVLLGLGGLSVKEAPYRFGFTDPYYFSRLFKKKTGLCPTTKGRENRVCGFRGRVAGKEQRI